MFMTSKPRETYAIKLQRSFYGLKQFMRMWYNRLSEYFLKEDYENNPIWPCTFIRKTILSFIIIVVYVDDVNIKEANRKIKEAIDYLKKYFEMKYLGKTRFCLGLQIEYTKNSILVHQSNYTKRVLKRFNMDKENLLSTSIMGRTLIVEKDPFRSKEDNEEDFGSKVPYLSVIGALMYLANCTRPYIAFEVNLLARCGSCPAKRCQKEIKHIFWYLWGTYDLGLFYSNNTKPFLLGYVDARYLSYPDNAKSHIGYLFTYGDTAISWRLMQPQVHGCRGVIKLISNHNDQWFKYQIFIQSMYI